MQCAGSNKALEFLYAGSIDFGSTADSAALVANINGNPIKSVYVYSRPEWTALVKTKDSKIASVADLKGKRVAVTRGTDPHIFLFRALLDAKLSDRDITPVLLQHADGKAALIRGDVDAWASLDQMIAQAEVEDGAKLFFRKPEANTWRILNVREQFLNDYQDAARRVLAVIANGGWGLVGFGIAVALMHVTAPRFGSLTALSVALSTCVARILGLWAWERRKVRYA